MESILKSAEQFMDRIALWEALRTIPFALCSGVLIMIALRLRKGDRTALKTARVWVLWAFLAVAVSTVVQAMVTVPATIEYQAKVMAAMPMPGGSGAGFDVKDMVGSMTTIAVWAGVFFGAFGMAVWPLVLFFWSKKLTKETAPAA